MFQLKKFIAEYRTQTALRTQIIFGLFILTVIGGSLLYWQNIKHRPGRAEPFGEGPAGGSLTGYDGAQLITSDLSLQLNPSVGDDKIVWVDQRSGGEGIYLYPLPNGPEQKISSDHYSSANPVISGNKIVWSDGSDIKIYDLTNSQTQSITNNSSIQIRPSISGDKIVWQDNRNGNWDIYLYDLTATPNAEHQITSNSADQKFPIISGNKIVWEDSRWGNADIYLYSWPDGPEQRITTDPHEQTFPSISGDKIVWEDDRSGNWDIYQYNLSSGPEQSIITEPHNQTKPIISGDKIVWEDDRNSNLDIYLFDPSKPQDNQEQRLTTDPHGQKKPAFRDNQIVWMDDRLSFIPSPPIPLNYDIFLYELPYIQNLKYGWNHFAIPDEPYNPDPTAVFGMTPEELTSSALNRYETASKCYIPYDEFDPSIFGNLTPSDGYWFYCRQTSGCPISYKGRKSDQMIVDLSIPGWHMIGTGRIDQPLIDNPKFVFRIKGTTEVFSHYQAWVEKLWVGAELIHYNPDMLYYETTTVDPVGGIPDPTVNPNKAYWFYTVVPNLELVITQD